MKDSWGNLTIDDIVEDISDGGTPPRTDSENFGGSIPWVVIDDIKSEIYTTKEYLSEKGFKNCSSKLWPINTLILSTGATIGEVGLAKVPLTTKQGIAGIKLKEIIDIDYAYYIFLSLKNEIQRLSQGSTIQEIRPKYLKQIGVKITNNKLQQRKIASILSTCDKVIEKTEAAIAKYQALKQGMMHDLFTRGIDVKTGKLRPSYQDAPELYKESDLGMIPKDWEVKRVDQVGRTLTGNTPSTNNPLFYDGNVMFISPADLFGQKNIEKTQKNITELGLSVSREIPSKSISVVCIGSTIGKVSMTTQLCASNQQINSLIPFDIELSDFLYYSSHQFLVHQLFIEAGLQAVPIVNKSTFDTLNILLPNDKQEAKGIATRLITIDNKIEKEKVSLSKHQQLKTGLMQDLLTGKIEVSVAEEILKN